MNQTNCILSICLLNLRFKSTILALYILVPFHCVSLASTCLSISKYGGVITLNHLVDHLRDSTLLEELLLTKLTVAHLVKLKGLSLLIPRIKLQMHLVFSIVNQHLAGCVRLGALLQDRFALQQRPDPNDDPYRVQQLTLISLISLPFVLFGRGFVPRHALVHLLNHGSLLLVYALVVNLVILVHLMWFTHIANFSFRLFILVLLGSKVAINITLTRVGLCLDLFSSDLILVNA